MNGKAKLDAARARISELSIIVDPAPAGKRDILLAMLLLADAMSCLPDWIWDAPNCCPPGESCCNCD